MSSTSNIDLTPELKEKIKVLLKEVVVKSHTNRNKQMIKDMSGRLNLACPYCGDSTKDDNMKRGNLFWNTLQYHCFNCDYHTNIYYFLKDFGVQLPDKMDAITLIAYVKSRKNKVDRSEKFTPFVYEKILELSVEVEDFSKATGAMPIHIGDWIWFKLKERLLHKKLDNFLFNPKDQRLWILNRSLDGRIIGAQCRRMRGKGSRYLTYDLSKIHEAILNKPIEMDEETRQQFNNVSTLFGALRVNFQNPVTIFEGPLDALFMRNSIALCTAGRDTTKLDYIESSRYMLDNDETGLKKSIEKLKTGKRVFMWNKYLKDKKIDKYNIKDLNDLVKVCYSEKIKLSASDLEKYFTNNKLDLRYV